MSCLGCLNTTFGLTRARTAAWATVAGIPFITRAVRQSVPAPVCWPPGTLRRSTRAGPLVSWVIISREVSSLRRTAFGGRCRAGVPGGVIGKYGAKKAAITHRQVQQQAAIRHRGRAPTRRSLPVRVPRPATHCEHASAPHDRGIVSGTVEDRPARRRLPCASGR